MPHPCRNLAQLPACFCLGAALARLEARVALEGLVPLLAECEPSQSVAPFVDSFLVRGRTHLPLAGARVA